MNQAELERRLLAAARAQAPSEGMPYAFEKRVMARLRSRAVADAWVFWERALWRAAGPCIVIAMLFGAWSWLAPAGTQSPDLSQDFENTVLAASDQETSADTIW